jgi:hypothetical protein
LSWEFALTQKALFTCEGEVDYFEVEAILKNASIWKPVTQMIKSEQKGLVRK